MVLLSYNDKEGFFKAEDGDPVYRFVVQHSKSAQAKCRKCSEKIPKNVLRVGKPIKFNGWIASWVHLDCFWLEAGENDTPDKPVAAIKQKEVFGLSKLNKEEKSLVLDALKRTSPPQHLKTIDPDSLVVEKKFRRGVAGPKSLTVSLLPFQEEGYGWMRKQERSRYGGGILADQMGMGKTIQTIALLCGDKEEDVDDLSDSDIEVESNVPTEQSGYKESREANKKKPSKNGKKKVKGTNEPKSGPALIVCPSSAMLQWYDEIKRCTVDDTLKVLVYHSANRHKHTPKDILDHDVVLTSYPILEYDYRQQVNSQKVSCEYCNRKFLPHKLSMHLRYFCGPEAVRTERMQKRERKREQATKKAMATLNITKDTKDIVIGSKTPDKSFPTPSNIYRELMVDANKTPVPMYTSAKEAQIRQKAAADSAKPSTPSKAESTPNASRNTKLTKATPKSKSKIVEEETENNPRRSSSRASARKASEKLKGLVESEDGENQSEGDEFEADSAGSDADDNDDEILSETQTNISPMEDETNKPKVVSFASGSKEKEEDADSSGDARGYWLSNDKKIAFWKPALSLKAAQTDRSKKRDVWCSNHAFLNGKKTEFLRFEQLPKAGGEESSAIVLKPLIGKKKIDSFLVRLDGSTVSCCQSSARVMCTKTAASKRKWKIWQEGHWPAASDQAASTFTVPKEMVANGWEGIGPNVGNVVVRGFGNEMVVGVVVAHCNEVIADGEVDPELWHIKHLDGDFEDLEGNEMSDAQPTNDGVLQAGKLPVLSIPEVLSDTEDSDFEGTPSKNKKGVAIDIVSWMRDGMKDAKDLKFTKSKSHKKSKRSKKRSKKSSSTNGDDNDDYIESESSGNSSSEDEVKESTKPIDDIRAMDKALAEQGKLLKTNFVPATWGAADGIEDDSDGVLPGTKRPIATKKTPSKSSRKSSSKRKRSPKAKSKSSSKKVKTPKLKKGAKNDEDFIDSDSTSSSEEDEDEGRMWAKQASQSVRIKSSRVQVQFCPPGDVVDDEGIDLGKSLLHCIGWKRIVLDEAHKIKDRVNSTAKAVFALRGDPQRSGPGGGSGGGGCNRWCLSGTPLQNRVGELYSLVKFLRVDPYAFYMCKVAGCECKCLNWSYKFCEECGHPPMKHFSYFNQKIINPIKRIGYTGDGRKAMMLLHTDLIGKLMLRRTKEERASDINLPPLTIEIRKIKLGDSERDFYESVYKNTHAKFDTYVKKGTLMHNYAHIFELLSRLRQAVDHPYLVIHGNKSATQTENYQSVSTSGRRSDVCGICFFDITSLKEVAVSSCRHTFHKSCIQEYMENVKEEVAPDDELELGADGPVEKKKNTRGKKRKGKEAKPNKKEAAESSCNCPVCFVPLSLTVGIHGGKDSSNQLSQVEDDGSDDLCVVCLDKPREALLMPCGHIYMCVACAQTLDKRICPMCRQDFNKVVKVDSTEEAAGEGSGSKDNAKSTLPLIGKRSILQRINMEAFSSSSKTDSVVEAILNMLQMNHQSRGTNQMSHKAIVFSQYTSMLEIVEWKLKTLNIQTVKLVGSMSMQARRAAIAAFKGQQEPEVSVILMSLKAGGEGLNLQEASHVLVLEPWWNPAVEMQAIQRAHRIGQKRAVHAIRFCVEDSIEEKMLDLQEKKKLVFEGTVDGSKAALSQLTEQDMRFLFSRG